MPSSELTEAELRTFKRLAAQIINDDEFGDLLAKSSPANRLTMYESIKPYLSFKPKPYWWFAHRKTR